MQKHLARYMLLNTAEGEAGFSPLALDGGSEFSSLAFLALTSLMSTRQSLLPQMQQTHPSPFPQPSQPFPASPWLCHLSWALEPAICLDLSLSPFRLAV